MVRDIRLSVFVLPNGAFYHYVFCPYPLTTLIRVVRCMFIPWSQDHCYQLLREFFDS